MPAARKHLKIAILAGSTAIIGWSAGLAFFFTQSLEDHNAQSTKFCKDAQEAFKIGNLVRAERLFGNALTEAKLAQNSLCVADTSISLAKVYLASKDQAKLAKATALIQSAIAGYQQLKANPRFADAVGQAILRDLKAQALLLLADSYQLEGRLPDAEKECRAACLEIAEDQAAKGKIIQRLANILRAEGKETQAAGVELEMNSQDLTFEDWRRIQTDAEILAYQKADFEAARKKAEIAVCAARSFGDKGKRLARSLHLIGNLGLYQDMANEATGALREAIEIETRNGTESSAVESLALLSAVLDLAGKKTESESIRQRLINMPGPPEFRRSIYLTLAQNDCSVACVNANTRKRRDIADSFYARAMNLIPLAQQPLYVCSVSWAAGASALSSQNYSDAQHYFQRGLETARSQLNSAQCDSSKKSVFGAQYVQALCGLAAVSLDQNRPVKETIKQLTLAVKKWNPKSSDAQDALIMLGNKLIVAKDFEASKSVLGLALKCAKTPQGTQSAYAYFEIAQCYSQTHQYADAEIYFQRSLDLWLLVEKSPSKHAVPTMNCLLDCLMRNHKFKQAEQIASNNIALAKQAYGDNSDEEAETYSLLASTYGLQSKFADEERCWRRTIEIKERSTAVDHTLLKAGATDRLGDCLFKQHQFSRAQDCFKQALSVFEKISGPNCQRAKLLREKVSRCLALN